MNKIKKTFDSVEFFRKVKDKLFNEMKAMTLEEKQAFLRKVKEGKIKISL